jgi:hypothetical protein
MEDIYSLPPREQAERLRALFKYLDQQYMDLVAFYHLLVPTWSLQTLIDRFNGTRRVSGFKLVRSALLDTCILAITKLLVDGDDANPSLLTMVRPFLQRNRQKRTELLQILEFDYSDWARRISPEERKTEPEWAIKMFEEEGERHAEACRKEFWERADSIASDWPKLMRASEKFLPIRNKWIAHFEVEYDLTTKEYKPIQLPLLRDVYFTIEDVVPTITETVSHLAGVFKNLDISTEQFAAFAKRDALAFWEISEPL